MVMLIAKPIGLAWQHTSIGWQELDPADHDIAWCISQYTACALLLAGLD